MKSQKDLFAWEAQCLGILEGHLAWQAQYFAFWGEHQTLSFSFKMSARSRKVSSPNGRVLADEFMTNARVGRTRIGVVVSCDVRYGMML